MKSIGKLFLYIVLLGAGFFVGSSWSNYNQDRLQQENPQESEKLVEPSSMPSNLDEDELETIRLFENASSSVVYITTSRVQTNYWTRNVMEIPSGSGSGFIWDDNGHIVTNYHVIKDVLNQSGKAIVTLYDQSNHEAQIIGVAPEKDLAVLKINIDPSKLLPIPVGVSDNLRVGQAVYAIGNPFGLDYTLTTGIISALGREIDSPGQVPIRDVIQTDAAINPGNSGGPLLNSSGQLVGVNTAILSPSGSYAGIGFSIPVDAVNWVVPDLINFGKVNRPILGVELLTYPRLVERLDLEGVLVMNVTRGTGADRAGIQGTTRDRNGEIELGDIIIGVNNTKITSNSDLLLALEEFKAGDVVNLEILRKTKKLILEVELSSSK